MAIRPILIFGDLRLEATNEAVEHFGSELHRLVDDLFETGWRAPGLGLAAPQVGVNIRLATIDLSVGTDPDARIVLANPEIVDRRGKIRIEEGCLSFPGLFTNIERPTEVRVRAQDEHGVLREMEADGLLAQAVCHELDHLDGVLLVHHLRGLKRRLFMRKVEKMRKLGVWRETA